METKLFDLVSDYQPQGDQPKAIQELVDGIQKGKKQQVFNSLHFLNIPFIS